MSIPLYWVVAVAIVAVAARAVWREERRAGMFGGLGGCVIGLALTVLFLVWTVVCLLWMPSAFRGAA